MLKIRLTRMGKKHQPQYRIVVMPKENPTQGKYLTSLGTYNPLKENVTIDTERVLEWLNKGAQPSNRIARLLEKAGVKHKSVVVKQYHTKPKKEQTEEQPAAPTGKPEDSESSEAPKETKTEEAETPEPEPSTDESSTEHTKESSDTETTEES